MAGAVALAVPIIAKWEGSRHDPYRDIVGVWTVCYGETRVEMRRYTEAECLVMLESAVGEFAGAVLVCTPGLRNRPEQLAAATSLTYNIGQAAYCRSTVARKFNAGDLRGACEAFGAWVYAGGKRVQGLANRRAEEARLCLSGL
jgi:lysozyme